MRISRPTMDPLLEKFSTLNASDLYLTVGCVPSARVQDGIVALSEKPLNDVDVESYLTEILSEEERDQFYSVMEFNAPLHWREDMRFRINVFRQQQHTGIVIRRIQMHIPTLEALKLPAIYREVIMESRGLVLIVGPTGSGKSTSLAAMIGYRNKNGYGHIVTVEDPIEFIHKHDNCIITQRDVGTDTYSFDTALKNVLRQRPDVVLIGEIRDRETMEHALHFSETGHLCVATLHAGNTSQAIERILSFFPEAKQHQVRYTLANNLRAILCQKLVLTTTNERVVAIESLLNRGFIRSLIQENRVRELTEVMAKNRGEGMQTFDQALFDLYSAGLIGEEVACAESDNPANIRLQIRQHINTRKHPGAAEALLLRAKPTAF